MGLIHLKEPTQSHSLGKRTTPVMLWFTTKNRLIRVICWTTLLTLHTLDSLQRVIRLEIGRWFCICLICYLTQESFVQESDCTAAYVWFIKTSRLIQSGIGLHWFSRIHSIRSGIGLIALHSFDSLQRSDSLQKLVWESDYTESAASVGVTTKTDSLVICHVKG